MTIQTKPMDILLVEDNPGDIRLMQEVFRGMASRLTIARDGEQALAYLRREGDYKHCRRPALIVLDLNLPRKDGREVLSEIKCEEALKCIPVVIFTTSSSEEDIRHAYRLHANCYITKPIDLDRFYEVGRSIEDFWLTTAALP